MGNPLRAITTQLKTTDNEKNADWLPFPYHGSICRLMFPHSSFCLNPNSVCLDFKHFLRSSWTNKAMLNIDELLSSRLQCVDEEWGLKSLAQTFIEQAPSQVPKIKREDL